MIIVVYIILFKYDYINIVRLLNVLIVIIWLGKNGYSKLKGIFIYLRDYFIVFIIIINLIMKAIMIIIWYKK